MDEMIFKCNKSQDEVVQYFLEKGQLRNMSLHDRMQQLLGGENMSEDDKLSLLRQQLGPKSREQLEEMLGQGLSIQDILKHFGENGKSAEEESEELRVKIEKLLSEGNLSSDEVLSALAADLTLREMQTLNELIQKGLTTEQILKEIMKIKEKEREFSEQEQMELLKNQLGEKAKEELEKMLQKGHSVSDVIKYFMSPGNVGSSESLDFENTILNILRREDLSEKEKLDVIISKLNETEKKILEAMLNEGKSLEEIIKRLFEKQNSNSEQTSNKNVTDILNNSTLSIEEKFELLKGNMKPSELTEIQKLTDKGLTVEQALKKVADIDESSDSVEESDFAKRIKKLISGKSLSQNEILEIIRYGYEFLVIDLLTRQKY